MRTVYGIQGIKGLIAGSAISDIDLRNNFIVGLDVPGMSTKTQLLT